MPTRSSVRKASEVSDSSLSSLASSLFDDMNMDDDLPSTSTLKRKAPEDANNPSSGKRTRTELKVLSNLPADQFFDAFQEYCNGPKVTVVVNDKPYLLSKSLLCDNSPVFDRTFNGGFAEAGTDEMTLTDTSNGTFELVVQYLHTGKFILPANIRDSVETVTQLLDFAVLTDVLLIPNAHTAIGERLTSLLKPFTNGNANTRLPLHTEHLANALGLPEGHPIRVLIVQACVFMYLRSIHRLQKFKFEKELREIDGFAADMFCEVDKVMRLKGKNRGLVFAGEVWVCPMTGEQGRL